MGIHICEYMNILETVYKISNRIMGSVRNYPEMPTIQRLHKASAISNNLSIWSSIKL